MAISSDDIQSVFDAVEGLSDDELKILGQRLDKLPHHAAKHLARFVKAHIKQNGNPAPNRFGKDTTAAAREVFTKGGGF